MNYPQKQGNTWPCGNYEPAFWPILKVHNFDMSVSLKIQTSPDWRRWDMATAQIPTIVSSWIFLRHCFLKECFCGKESQGLVDRGTWLNKSEDSCDCESGKSQDSAG